MRLRIPTSDDPIVSVVTVLYGGGALAVDAAASLVAHTDVPFEWIVVDNASPDDSADVVESQVAGVRLLREDRNHGFGGGSNLGVERARGRFVCLLNPDTLVTAGWWEPLVTVAQRAEVGAVAPILVDADGIVHEAGAVVDHWGLTAPPRARSFDEPIEPPPGPCLVDYASAACLVLRTEVYREVGGFDPAFDPAYFEDADLAFRLWDRGLEVWCVPQSRVVHHRGASSGSGDWAEAIWHQNRSRFLTRWRAELARRPALADPTADLGRLAVWREPAFRPLIEDVPPVGTPCPPVLGTADTPARRPRRRFRSG